MQGKENLPQGSGKLELPHSGRREGIYYYLLRRGLERLLPEVEKIC